MYHLASYRPSAGGILASSHLATKVFVEVADAIADERLEKARSAWQSINPMIPLLFSESNPMPLKYCLWRLGLVRSAECRLPLTHVSAQLASRLDEIMAGLPGQ